MCVLRDFWCFVFFYYWGQNGQIPGHSQLSFFWKPRIFFNLQQPSSALPFKRNDSERIIKTEWAPANKTSPPFNYAQPDLTGAIEMKTGFMQQPNHCVFFSIWGTNHRFPSLSFFPPAAVKLLRLLTFGIIPDSLWTFLSRCQLVWNVLRGSASTPVAAAAV